MSLRRALAAPFQLALPDLMAAVAIAVLALSLMAGPVLSQDSTGAPIPAASVAPGSSALAVSPGPQAAAPSVLPARRPPSRSCGARCGGSLVPSAPR
jgi:hypothetical protein